MTTARLAQAFTATALLAPTVQALPEGQRRRSWATLRAEFAATHPTTLLRPVPTATVAVERLYGRGWTTATLAAELAVTPGTVRRWARGGNASAGNMTRLAALERRTA